ncbi:MAG: S41 family peptidase [Phycisphaerales bacterium]|nr:S41 family peptidase [Phycisphaerales bacterium]
MRKTVLRYSVLVSAIIGVGLAFSLVLAVPANDSGPKEAASDVSAVAMTLAINGRFEGALRRFEDAAKLDTDNAELASSVKLLKEYLANRSKMDQGRAEEYDRAVARVQRCLLVIASEKFLAKDDLSEKLREKLDDALTDYDGGGAVSDLADVSTEKASELQTKTLKDVDQLRKNVEGTVKLLKGDKSEFSQTYNKLISEFSKRCDLYNNAWRSVKLGSKAERSVAIKTLWPLQYDQAVALGDIEAMTAEKPWRIAITQIRLAKQLIGESVDVSKKPWYAKVVTMVSEQGEKALADQDWHEALSAYWSLSELKRGDDKLRAKVKICRRHVRVLNMYGKDEEEEKKKSDKKKDDPTDEDTGVTWQEMVAGADANLVEKAIEKLSRYVARVDYRKVAAGALDSIKILALTPEAGASFPKLKDETLRKKFIESLESMGRDIAARDRVSQMDLQLALNGVLRASEKTVEIPTTVLVVEFADGMLERLDKFSSMIWPHDVSEFQKQIRGSFVGAGVQIFKEPKEPLKVVTPIDDAPAFRAGIKRGDLILAVDGKETKNLHVSKLVKLITGQRGTKVVLRIKRDGRSKPFDVTIVREPIIIRTVKGWRRHSNGKWDHMLDKEAGVGYIRVTQFADKTAGDIKRELATLKADGAKLIILDLRFNPGGRLDSAIQIADEFLASGPIVSTKGINSAEAGVRASSTGRGKGEFEQGELIVLVNEQSASASEIVSGALQDLHRGMILGGRTYGKGSVQKVYSLRWDPLAQRPVAQMKLTTAYYYLPSKRLLHRKPGAKVWGVTPDVKVPFTPRQIRYWLDIRYNTDLLQEVEPKQLTAELNEQLRADLQLNTALMLLKLKQLNSHDSAKVASK